MKQKDHSLTQRLLIGCVLSLVATVLLLAYHRVYQHRLDQQMKEHAQEMARQVARKIDAKNAELVPISTTIADDLTSGELAYKDIALRMKQEVDAHPQIFSLGTAFEPKTYDPQVELYAPYWVKNQQGKFDLVALHERYDYTRPVSEDPHAPKTAWYHDPLREGALWNEPYFGTGAQTLLAEYSVPFYADTKKDQAQGVVFISYDLAGIQRWLDQMELGKTGYGFLVSKEGKFMAHPLFDKMVKGEKTIFDGMGSRQHSEFQKMANKALKGERGAFVHRDVMTRQSSWMVYEPIASTGWSLWVVFINDVSLEDKVQLGRQKLWILFSGMIFLLLIMWLAVCRGYAQADPKKREHLLWVGVIGMVIVSVLVLGGIWSLAMNDQLPDPGDQSKGGQEKVMILDKTGLEHFFDQQKVNFGQSGEDDLHKFPTGVYIKSLEFISANNVKLSGSLWQKYELEAQNSVSPGIVLNTISKSLEFISADKVKLSDKWKKSERKAKHGISPGIVLDTISDTVTEDTRTPLGEDRELAEFTFQATVRQNFDYTKYPFDRLTVWLRMWHPEYEKGGFLVPDLDSYRSLYPASLPGIEEDIVVPGWNLERSYFTYDQHYYNTTFGYDSYDRRENDPEMYFAVEIQRHFLDAFIQYFSPLVVVAFMVFGILVGFTRQKKQVSPLPRDTVLGVLGACSGLFFVVLLGHIHLREVIEVPRIMYLEYFYFVMYDMIIGVSMYALLLASERIEQRWVHDGGRLVKLLYWPVMLMSMVLITFGVFY